MDNIKKVFFDAGNSCHAIYNEKEFYSGQTYLCLGFTGMEDGIVLVNAQGLVFEVPYNEEYFSFDC